MTVPTLAILIVISSYVRVVDLGTMSLILGMMAWTHPTRVIRSQVLTLRERGYVRMALLSGVHPIQIISRDGAQYAPLAGGQLCQQRILGYFGGGQP